MGYGFQMSNRRKSRNATACRITLADEMAASGRKATISSQHMLPWSATPRSRPVRSHAHTPTKKRGIATNATASAGMTCMSAQQIGNATSVPAVPGAIGDRPAPNPSAMKCAGCETRKRASGRSGEVVVSAAIDLHRLAVGAQQAHALAALHLPDARERHAQHVGELGDAFARVGRRREAQLVVVAAGDDGGTAGIVVEVLGADRRDRDRAQLYRGTHAREP